MKAYVKPDLYFENYSLSESIATSCAGGWIVRGNQSLENCFAQADGDSKDPIWGNIKIYTNDSCEYTQVEDVCNTVAVTGESLGNAFGAFGSY